jgi:hypothetical protein
VIIFERVLFILAIFENKFQNKNQIQTEKSNEKKGEKLSIKTLIIIDKLSSNSNLQSSLI